MKGDYNNRYDISFIDGFLNKNKITKKSLSDAISITCAKLYYALKNGSDLALLESLLNLFNVESYEEFKIGATENALVIPECLFPKVKYDISCLGPYLLKYKIAIKAVANNISVPPTTVGCNIYNGATESFLNKILKLFNVKTYEELKQGVLEDTLVIPDELLKANKVGRLRNSINIDIIKKEDNLVDHNKYIYSEDEIPNILKIIDIDKMLSLIDESSISDLDFSIIMLIFGGSKNSNKYYKIDAISNIFNIEKGYVVDLYKKCLKMYEEAFSYISKEHEIILRNEYNK